MNIDCKQLIFYVNTIFIFPIVILSYVNKVLTLIENSKLRSIDILIRLTCNKKSRYPSSISILCLFSNYAYGLPKTKFIISYL